MEAYTKKLATLQNEVYTRKSVLNQELNKLQSEQFKLQRKIEAINIEMKECDEEINNLNRNIEKLKYIANEISSCNEEEMAIVQHFLQQPLESRKMSKIESFKIANPKVIKLNLKLSNNEDKIYFMTMSQDNNCRDKSWKLMEKFGAISCCTEVIDINTLTVIEIEALIESSKIVYPEKNTIYRTSSPC